MHRLLAILSFVAIVGAVDAAPITFSFEGVVDDDPFALFNDPFGSPATVVGTYTFDSAMPQVLATANSGGYADAAPNAGMTMLFANTFDASVVGPYIANQLNITVNNDFPGPLDQYLVTGTSSTNSFLSLELTLEDFTGTALLTTALPLAPPSLGAFASPRFSFATFDGNNDVQAGGVLTSLVCVAGCTNTVPEPSTAWLLLAAIALLLARHSIGPHPEKRNCICMPRRPWVRL